MHRYVHVQKEHDLYGFGIYLIKEENGSEYVLTHHNRFVPKEGFSLFKCHCNRNHPDAVRATLESFQKACVKAQQIGMNKNRRHHK